MRTTMHLKAVFFLGIVSTALAGPLRSDSRCATECTDGNNLRYEKGRTYKYRYTTTSTSLINGTSEDRSGFQINADVEIEVLKKCDMILNLENVRIQEVSPSDEMLHPDKVDFFRRALEEKPLAFSFQDGEIPEICPDMEEQPWVLNIKRGVLSHFQTSYFKDQKKSAIETDVTGSCPTKFLVETGYYGKQTIKKSKDFMGCSDRHHIESALQSTIYDPRAPSQSLVRSNQNCDQEIEDERVKSVVCKETHISRPFANHDNAPVTKVRTTFELYDVTRKTSNAYKIESQVQTRKTLLFEHKPKPQTESEDESKVEEVLDEICRTAANDVRPETAEHFTKLVFRMRKLKVTSLRSIHRHIKDGRICGHEQEKMEKFFMDAIPMMSTSASVAFMKEKISSDEVEGKHADMWMLSLSFITHPTKEMIREIRDLVQYAEPRRSTYLAVSSMIHKYCETEQRDCLNDDEITSTLRVFEENLGWKCYASTEGEKEKILLSLKALGNSGQISSATNTLTRCFQEEENPTEIRLAAIEAFRRMPCEVEGREELMKMHENRDTNTEVRIASYLAVMKCPTNKILKRVRKVLEKEEINQVGSFVWSHLKGLNSTSDPLKQEIRKMLDDTALVKDFNKDPRKFSRAFEGSLFSEKLNVGGTVENHLIFSPESWIPRSAMMNMTTQIFGYSINLFEFGGRIEGFDYLLESFFGPKGYFPDNSLLEMVKTQDSDKLRPKRSAIKPGKLDNVHDRFDAKQDNQPRGSMYMKMFGNELSFFDFQKIDWMTPGKESVNLLDMLIKLSKEQTKEFTKNMILMESSFDTPTIIGMPLNLVVNSTASMNLKVSGKADLRKIMVAPRSLNITGAIRPSGVVEVSTEMSMCAFIARTGLRTVTRMHSSTALDGSISLDSSETFKVKFNVPDNRLEIIDVSNRLYLVNSEFQMEIEGITENYRKHSKCTGHIVEKWAGVRLCGDLKYPNASHQINAPYFPLTGPVSAKITLYKVDPSLTSYQMEAKYQVQKKRVNAKTEISDVLRFMIGTPGTHMPRTHSVDVVLNRAQKALNIDLVTLEKKLFVQTKMVNETDIKRLELNLNYNNMKQYTTSAEIAIDRTRNQVRYMPTFEVRLPNRMDMTLSGTVTHEPQRSLETVMTYEGIGGKAHFEGKIVNDTNMKSVALSTNYNDGAPYVLNAEVGIDRGYQQVRFRPTIEITIPSHEKNLHMSGSITHQTDRSLEVDMTLRGAREQDITVTANINGEKWRRMNAELTLRGIKTEDITFTTGIKNEMWRSLNVDMSLVGLTTSPLSLTSNIEGEKWSRLNVDTTLRGIKTEDIVFTGAISGEKWRRLNLDMSLKGVRQNDLVLSTAITGEKWRSLDSSITLKGIRENDIVLSAVMNGEPWRSHDSTITLKGVREQDIVLRTTLRGEPKRSFDGSMTLRGIKSNDIRLSANMRGEPMRRFEGSITLAGVRPEEMTLSTNLNGEMGKSFDGSVTLKGVRTHDIVLSTNLKGEAWKSFEGSMSLVGTTENPLSLETTLSGEKWKTLDGSITLKGIRQNDISLTTNVNAEPWRSLNGHITLRGVKENEIVLTTNMNGEKGRNFNGVVTLRGITENDVSLQTHISGEPWRSFNADLTIAGIRKDDIVFRSKITGEQWRSLDVDISLRGAHERPMSLKHTIEMEYMRSLDVTLTMEGFNKMLTVTHKLINNEALKRFEFDVNVNNDKRFTTNAEVAIDGQNNMVRYMPTFEVHLPNGKNLIVRGSVAHQQKRVVDVYFTVTRQGAVELTVEGRMLNENNEKLTTDLTLTHSAITLVVNSVLQHTNELMSSDWEIDYTLKDKPTHSIIAHDSIRNRTADGKHHYEYVSTLKMTQWPQYNFDGTFEVQAAPRREGSIDMTICYGERTCEDPNTKFTFNLGMKNESNIYVNKASASMAVAHQGHDVDFSMDMSHENTRLFLQSQMNIMYKPRQRISMLVELRNETRELKKMNGLIKFNIPTREVSLKHNYEEVRPKNHVSETTLQWADDKQITVRGEYNNNSDDFKFDHNGKGVLSWPGRNVVMQASAFKDESKINGDFEFNYAPNRAITFGTEYKNKSNKRKTSHEVTVRFDTPFRLFRDMQLSANLDKTSKLCETEVTMQYAPRKSVSMQGRYQNAGEPEKTRHEVEVTFNIPRREIHFFTYVQNNTREYEFGSQFSLVPEFGDKKEFTFALGYGNYTDNTKLHHEISMEVSTENRNILSEFGFEKSDRALITEMLVRWNPDKQMTFTLNFDNKSVREQTEFDASMNFIHPSRQIIVEFHHENTTSHINSKVDLSWEPTSKMTTELAYSKRPVEDKDHHATRFTITHPQKTIALTHNLEKNEREFSNDFEMKLDGKTMLKLESDYKNGTNGRRMRHDADVTFECEPLFTDPIDFEFHIENTELDFNMDVKLTYQRDQEIEVEISHNIPRKSENHQRDEISFKLDTPLKNDNPLRTIEVEGSWERSDNTHTGDLELQWGRKRKSQKVSVQGTYERKVQSGRKEHNVEMKLKHPLELTLIPQEPEMKLHLINTPDMKESKITYKWSDLKETSMETVYHNYSTASKMHHLVDVIIKHPSLDEDIHMTTETKMFNGPELFNTMVSIIYSPQKQKEFFFRTKAMNKTTTTEFRYGVESEMRHLYNNIDIALTTEIGNTEKKADGTFDMTYKSKDTYHTVKFDGEVNKKEKSFMIKTENPLKDMEFDGKFENRSTAEHSIFYITLHNKYDGWKEIHSSIDINTKERLFEATIHHDYERPEDYARLTAQFLNRTAVEVRAHRNIRGVEITDALISARLNTSELLHTRIHWRPQMPREVKEYTLRTIKKINETIRVEIIQALKEKYWEMKYWAQDEIRRIKQENAANLEIVKDLKKLGEEVKTKVMEIYHENKPEYKEKLEELKETVKAKYEEIRTKAMEQYKEFEEKYMNEMKETMTERWNTIREHAMEYYDDEIKPVLAEIKEAWEDVSDMARKDFDDVKEYWTEQYEEMRAMLEEHTKVLREMFEEYKTMIMSRWEELKEKLEELKAEAKLKLKEYEQKWEEAKVEIERVRVETMEKMMAKWNETKAIALKKWEESKAIIMKKWEENKAMIEKKYEEYRAIAMEKYEEYKTIAMKKWEETRELAMKKWEEAKTKAIAKWEEYKEEYGPQYEELKQRFEKISEEIIEKLKELKWRWEEIRDDMKNRMDEQYKEIMSMREVQEIMEMKVLKDVPHMVVEEAKWAWNYWRVENNTREFVNRSIETTMRMIGELREELKSKYIRFEPENGNIFITIPLPVKMHSFDAVPDIRGTHFDTLRNIDLMDMYYRYKPSMDIRDWIPPHKSHAMVAGQQHFMTFDKKFYEFAGACSYVVARDFIDGNFSVIVNYDRESDKPIKNSLTVITQDKEIEIFPDFSIKIDDTPVELPIEHMNTTITREGSDIRVHNTHGVTVVCNLDRDVCTVMVSGWYFHKTAGLAGTYNNEPSDDFMTSDRRITNNAEDLARSWEVGKQCNNHMNRASVCENISETPRAEVCNKLFLDEASPLRKCFGLVSPQAFRQMCLNDLCEANEVDTETIPCNAAAAYVKECQAYGIPMYMPKICVACEKPNGGIFNKNENIKLTSTADNVPKSADIVVIVEEKKCNKEVAKELPDFIRQLDSEFKSQGLQNNRYGLVGFGGEGVHSEEHSHTIDSKLFNKARKFILGSDGLVFSKEGTNNDAFRAVRAAAQYPFRTGVAKSIIMLTCSDCSQSSISKDEIIHMLREQGISLHVMTEDGFKIKKSSIVVYGLDAKTVFTSKDVDNPFGTKDLREFVSGPENQCTRLAQESNGTVFDATRMVEKSFSGVFCPRMVFTTKPSPCQICECMEDVYGMGRSICRPCEEPRVIKPVKLEPSIRKSSKSAEDVQSSKEYSKSAMKNVKFDAWYKKQKS